MKLTAQQRCVIYCISLCIKNFLYLDVYQHLWVRNFEKNNMCRNAYLLRKEWLWGGNCVASGLMMHFH
jgi:hypothetical protein